MSVIRHELIVRQHITVHSITNERYTEGLIPAAGSGTSLYDHSQGSKKGILILYPIYIDPKTGRYSVSDCPQKNDLGSTLYNVLPTEWP